MTAYDEDTAKYIGLTREEVTRKMTESDLNKESGMNEEDMRVEKTMDNLQVNQVPNTYGEQEVMLTKDIKDLGRKLLFLSCKKYKYNNREIKNKERDVRNMLKEKLLILKLVNQADNIGKPLNTYCDNDRYLMRVDYGKVEK